MKKFDYNASVREVEKILVKVENPDTGVEESQKLIEKARTLLDGCYAYLRSERGEENSGCGAAQTCDTAQPEG